MSTHRQIDGLHPAAVLVPDPALTSETLERTGYTEAGPVPGRAVYQSGQIAYSSTTAGQLGPSLRVITSGEQDADQLLRVSRAGMPGEGCEVVRGVEADDAEVWYGWHPPTILETVCAASGIDRGRDERGNWAAVETVDRRLLIAWSDAGLVQCRAYQPSGRALGTIGTIADDSQSMATDGAGPSASPDVIGMLRLPSGRLYLGQLVEDGLAGGYQLAVHYSDDDGATWRSLTLHGLDVAVSVTTHPQRMVLAYSRERVLLLIHGEHDDGQGVTLEGWRQYASSDMGASYSLIETWEGTTDTAGLPTATVDEATGIITVIDSRPTTLISTHDVRYRRIESPYLPLRSVATTSIDSGTMGLVMPWVWAWSDPMGTQWVTWGPDDGAVHAACSRDGGSTWTVMATDPIDAQVGGPDRWSVHPLGAGAVWLLTDTSSIHRVPQDLLLVEAGGWTMLPQPRATAGYPYELRAWGGGDSLTWLPYSAPSSQGWIGPAGTMSSGASWGIRHTAPGSHVRAMGPIAPVTGLVIHAEVQIAVGAGIGSSEIGIRIELGDGTEDYRADIRLSTAEIGIYDVTGAVLVASGAYGLGSRSSVRVGIQPGRGGTDVAVWARSATGDAWELVGAGSLTRRTVGAGTTSVRWGHLGALTLDSTWSAVWVAVGGGVGAHGQTTDSPASDEILRTAPDSLPGAILPVAPYYLPLAGGLRVEGRGGPGLRGDRWRLEVAYRYPVDAVLTRSPRVAWRATGNTSARLAWEPADGQPHHPGGLGVGLAVIGCLVREVVLQGWDGAAWVDVAGLDLAAGMEALDYVRDGDTLRPAPLATGPFCRALDVTGGAVDLGGGVWRRIQSATSGAWSPTSAAASLRLADCDGTEPASGTMAIVRTSGAALALGAVTSYTRWAVLLPTQPTPEGYHGIGRVVVGAVHVLGQRPSRGRVVGYEARVETVEGGGAVVELVAEDDDEVTDPSLHGAPLDFPTRTRTMGLVQAEDDRPVPGGQGGAGR